MVVVATVADWERWTSRRFPVSGEYLLPQALQPLRVDVERDEGRYEDPNVWMLHAVSGG